MFQKTLSTHFALQNELYDEFGYNKVKTLAIMNILKNSSIVMRQSLSILETTTFCKFKSELSRGKYWYATPLNLRCRKSSILVIHIFRFWGSVFLNQTRVLSTWLSGGMGRNPRPGYNKIMIQTKPHQTLDLHFKVIRNFNSLKILCYQKQMIFFFLENKSRTVGLKVKKYIRF